MPRTTSPDRRPPLEDRARPAAVAVVGAINLDVVVSAPRLPRPGETVVGTGPERFGGGKGANAAIAAARAGARTLLIAAVGDDQEGREARDSLAREGVDVCGVRPLPGLATGSALIVVDGLGENQIAVGRGANGALDPDHVRAELEARAPELGCLLVSTEIPDETVCAAVELAGGLGLPCVLNPAPLTPAVIACLEHGPLLTPNVGELAAILEALGKSAVGEPGRDAEALARVSRAPVLLTRGPAGALLVDGAVRLQLAARPVEAVDTTGAGDTLNGVLAARLVAGDSLPAAARLAVHAASLSVKARGARAGMPRAGEIEASLAGS